MILTRVRPSIYLPCYVGIWSCVSAMTATAQGYGGLIAIRFALGIAEAPFFPGVCSQHRYSISRCDVYANISKGVLPSLLLVQPEGIGTAHRHSLFRLGPRDGILRLGRCRVFAGMAGYRGLAGWQWLLF